MVIVAVGGAWVGVGRCWGPTHCRIQSVPKIWPQGRRIGRSEAGEESKSSVQMWQIPSVAPMGIVHALRRSGRRISEGVGGVDGILTAVWN